MEKEVDKKAVKTFGGDGCYNLCWVKGNIGLASNGEEKYRERTMLGVSGNSNTVRYTNFRRLK
jgi:hypothetical protein